MVPRHHGVTAPALPAFVVALAVPISAGIASVFVGSSRVSVIAIEVVLILAGLVATVLLTQRSLPRASIIAAMATLAWLVVEAVGAARSLSSPLVDADRHIGCGLGITGLFALAVPVVGCFLFLLSVGLSVAGTIRSFDAAFHKAAIALVALGVIASVVSLRKAHRLDPDEYFSSLTTAAKLTTDAGYTLPGGSRRIEYVRKVESSPDGIATICRLEGVAESPIVDQSSWFDKRSEDDACPPLSVRVDPRGDYVFLFRDDVPKFAIRVTDMTAVTFSVASVSDRLAPPIGWRAAAAIGSLAGAVLLLLSRRMRGRIGTVAGRDALHLGAGRVRFGEEAPVLLPIAARLPNGPIVLLEEREHIATYRQAPATSFRRAVAGSLEWHRQAWGDRAAALSRIALAVAAFGVVPILVAWCYGF